ncbi:MAG: PorT family protein [Tannerella sp.]|jgi:hypothetical protein|nr:PorT family protein [Tannerella sp.]
MKTRLLWAALLCFPFGLAAQETIDTSFVVKGKRIQMTDDGERLNLQVFEPNRQGRSVKDEMVFEGHYRDGKSFERRKYMLAGITLPFWKQSFDPHWNGFGMGFANIASGLNVNDVGGLSLRGGTSLEYNLNLLEKAFPFNRQSDFAFVTGMGLRWSRYRLDMNGYLKEVDGYTSVQAAPEGLTYDASKLNITSLTIPFLIEWQNRGVRHQQKRNVFFVSAGLVGVVKTISSSKVVYHDERGKKHKEKMDGGMNLRPVNMDFLLQVGYNWIGLYAKYSPFSLFESHKGPDVQAVSLGLQLHW